MAQTPEHYADTFADMLLASAQQHPIVQVRIRREYTPILAADLYRGSVLLDNFDGPFEGSMADALVQSTADMDDVTIAMPADMAHTIALRLKAGGRARRTPQ